MDDEGNMKKESNARFVRWSDGSFSLHLGAEIFDVYKQPLQVNYTIGNGATVFCQQIIRIQKNIC